jgi:hypothetical protein
MFLELNKENFISLKKGRCQHICERICQRDFQEPSAQVLHQRSQLAQ